MSDYAKEQPQPKKSQDKRRIQATLLSVVVVLSFYFCVGVFVIQPIGAIPQGATVLYWRFGTKMSFISSADGLLLRNDQVVSLLARGIVLANVVELMEDRHIVSLPYSRSLYLFSTGGREFED